MALQSVSSLVPAIIDFIALIAKDEDKSESNLSNAIGLLGYVTDTVLLGVITYHIPIPCSDLCTSFGSHLSEIVNSKPNLTVLVNEGKRSRIKRTKTVSLWAAKELKRVQQSR